MKPELQIIILLLLVVAVPVCIMLYFLCPEPNLDKEPYHPLVGNEKISVIILNYNRPHNLEKSLPILNKYKVIDEIIVSHGNPKKFKNFDFTKVKNRKDYDNTWGAGIRFLLDLDTIKNDQILFLDDDLLPSENLVNILTSKIYNKPDKIYGPDGRTCNKFGYFHHSTNTILTTIMMTSKKVIKNYQNNFKKYEKLIIKNKGNCEDLTFNNNFIKNFNKIPKLVKGGYKKLDTGGGYSSNQGHKFKRFKYCTRNR